MDKPTDDNVIAALRAHPRVATYVVANILGRKRVGTRWCLRRLKALEHQGRVRRVPSSYAVMLCWEAV